MTKISNQYSLTNILTADLANSRLGINNVSPTVALDVTGGAKISASITAQSLFVTNGNNGVLTLGGAIYYGTIAHDASVTGANIYNVAAASGGGHNFQIGGSEKMRITSAGNVGIGTSTPLDTYAGRTVLTINNAGAFGAFLNFGYNGTLYAAMESNTTELRISNYQNIPTIFYTNTAERMRIAGNGDIMFKDTSGNNVVYFTAANPSLSFSYSVLNRTASSPMYWNSGTGQIGLNTSARRFKKDIVSITPEQTKIALLLNPVEYTRIETNEKEFGFIAEEVRDAGLGCFVPEIDGEALTIDYSKLSVFAIAMIKEQQKAIQELSAKVSLLENK